MISSERWSNRTYWRDIGIALQNEARNTYKDLFLMVAKEKSPSKFTTYEIEEDYWFSFVNPNFDGQRQHAQVRAATGAEVQGDLWVTRGGFGGHRGLGTEEASQVQRTPQG